jgi:hypothetical protein
MKEIDPRMERILTSQLKATFANAILALIVSFGSVFYFWDFGIENFIAGAIVAFVLNKIFNLATLTYLQHKNYAGKFNEMIEDAAYASDLISKAAASEEDAGPHLQQLSITIMGTPEKTTGRYMDTDFYEWLSVKGSDDKLVKIVFAGTISLEKGEIPPPGSIVLPPGLIYQVEAP